MAILPNKPIKLIHLNMAFSEQDIEKMKAVKDRLGHTWEDLIFYAVLNVKTGGKSNK